IDLIASAVGDVVATIVLPKVETPRDIAVVASRLETVEQRVGLGRTMRIDALLESALGVVNAESIAQASGRLDALVFGPGDYAASMGQLIHAAKTRDRGRLLDYPRMKILTAAKAFGLRAIDGPYPNFRDHAGLLDESSTAAAMGFDGKWV